MKGKIPNITNLATTSALATVRNKIVLVFYSKTLIITQKLLKLKRKLQIIIMINILLLQNLISLQKKFLITYQNEQIQQAKVILPIS